MVMGGNWPLVASICAPISASGVIMRRMGRLTKDSSPVSDVVNGCAAKMPDSMRMVEPELPASSVAAGTSQAVDAFAMNRENAPAIVLAERVAHAQRLHAGKRGPAICAGGVVMDFRIAIGNGGQHREAVRNRLVAGKANNAMNAIRRRDLLGHRTCIVTFERGLACDTKHLS